MKYIEVQERTDPWPSDRPYPVGAWLVNGSVYITNTDGQWYTMLMPGHVTLKATVTDGGTGVDAHRLLDQLIELKK